MTFGQKLKKTSYRQKSYAGATCATTLRYTHGNFQMGNGFRLSRH